MLLYLHETEKFHNQFIKIGISQFSLAKYKTPVKFLVKLSLAVPKDHTLILMKNTALMSN